MSLNSDFATVSGHPVVLVAEDETLIRMATSDALTEAGFEVMEARHAGEALNFLETRGPEIRFLFTDIEMPGGMSGLELADLVLQRWPWISVLVASGKWLTAPAGLPPGSQFLAKPYHIGRVIGQMRDLLAAHCGGLPTPR